MWKVLVRENLRHALIALYQLIKQQVTGICSQIYCTFPLGVKVLKEDDFFWMVVVIWYWGQFNIIRYISPNQYVTGVVRRALWQSIDWRVFTHKLHRSYSYNSSASTIQVCILRIAVNFVVDDCIFLNPTCSSDRSFKSTKFPLHFVCNQRLSLKAGRKKRYSFCKIQDQW